MRNFNFYREATWLGRFRGFYLNCYYGNPKRNGNLSSGLFGAPVDHLDESGESSGGRRITENGEILGLFTD